MSPEWSRSPAVRLAVVAVAVCSLLAVLTTTPSEAQGGEPSTPDPAAASIIGRVFHDEAPPVPVAGAQLGVFQAMADGSRGPWITDAFTDAAGDYAFTLGAGAYVITFIAPDGTSFAPGGARYRSEAVVVADGATAIVDGPLNPRGQPGTVVGRVVDDSPGSAPVVDQRLGVFTVQADGSRGRWLADTFTAADGSYRFTLPAGLYIVTFIAPDGATFVETGSPYYNAPARVMSGEATDVSAVVRRDPGQDLPDSDPIVIDTPGAVVDGLHITARGGPAVLITAPNVTISNLHIEHDDGPGIRAVNADGLVITDVRVDHIGAPATGPHDSAGENNIEIESSAGVEVSRVRLSRGSTGIYLVGSPDATLRVIEGHDFRGPFPRGQLVQFNASDRGLLEDFSVINPPGSWPEDNVNVYRSVDVVIRRGFIDGNNSPSGVGVIFDGGTATGEVYDVDAVRMGNGCFSNYDGASADFVRTRCRDNICDDQGRGVPSSNALMWAGNPAVPGGARIIEGTYAASCNGNLVWPADGFSEVDLVEADFTPRPPIELDWPWNPR